MEWNRITFFGFGLIGGSLAKAIKKVYPDTHISVLDKDNSSVQIALTEGIVNQELKTFEEIGKDCNLLFLCAPVEENRSCLKKLKKQVM